MVSNWNPRVHTNIDLARKKFALLVKQHKQVLGVLAAGHPYRNDIAQEITEQLEELLENMGELTEGLQALELLTKMTP